MAPNSPPSLWTDRRAGGDHPWLTPDRETSASETPTQPFPNGGTPPPRPPLTPRPEGRPPGRRGGAGRAVLATLAAIVVIALAVFAGTQLVGGDDSTTTPTGGATATVLPAVKGAAGATRINQIYAAVNKGVVSVKHAESGGVASGTGFVIDGRGTIVTNAHVVGDASQVQVQFDSK